MEDNLVKYEALLEKAKDFDNLRNGGIWKILDDLVEAVEDLLEENSLLVASKGSDRGFALGWKAAIKAAVDEISCGGCYGSCGDPINCQMDDVASIRSIPMPTDATAALDRLTVQAKVQGMREAAEIAAHRYAVCEEAYSKGLGAEERHCALEAKHIEDKILTRAEEIEKELSNE